MQNKTYYTQKLNSSTKLENVKKTFCVFNKKCICIGRLTIKNEPLTFTVE